MRKKDSRKEKINFLFETNHHRRLHLYIYLVSVLFIVSIYFLFVFTFSSRIPVIFVSGTLSIVLGVYLIFRRDKLIKSVSDSLQERKRRKLKEEGHRGLKTTLKTIRPKTKTSFKIKASFKDRLQHVKKKFKKNSKGKEYIEIK